MDRTLIEKYAAVADAPAKAIKGLSRQDLNWIPKDPALGKWTIQQLVIHLMDSHLIGADRMKRIIAEDNPTLIGYDENRFVKNLFPEKLDAALACEVFRGNQLLMAEILRQLPDSAFARSGNHNERGRLTLEQFVRDYANHVEHHLKFLRAKRKALGKPLD